MPRKYTISYHEVAAPITDLVTKFGGQPVWVADPQWPLSRDYGTPMQFVCQIALPRDLFGEAEPRMAYLFVTDDYEHDYVAETWEADGGENALILQPGGIWEGGKLPLREGPSLYRRAWTGNDWERTPCEFAAELQAGDDPEEGAWDDIASEDKSAQDVYFSALIEDKLGGTPVPTVNSARRITPGLGAWRFLLQLNTKDNEVDDPFFLNFADDGVGYAFLSEDGRLGKFLWSR